MNRLELLRNEMLMAKINALLVSDLASISWLSEFTGTFAQILVTPSSAIFITDSRYTIQAQEQVSGMDIRWFGNPVTGDQFVAKIISEAGLSEIYFESASMTYDAYDVLQKQLPSVNLKPGPNLFAKLRMVKTADEISKIHAMCKLTDAAFADLLPRIQPGRTEFDIHLDLEFYIRRHGADLAFTPIVVSGERSARPHGHASEKVIEEGDLLTLDFGSCMDGYNSDMTRTVVVGQPSQKTIDLYNAVLETQLAAIAAMGPGVPAKHVDGVARTTLAKFGLAEYFGHGLGHGLGRLVHDSGRMSPSSSDILGVGNVWTVEPGAYLPGFGGVRIEDDVVITENGIENLTGSPKNLIIAPTSL